MQMLIVTGTLMLGMTDDETKRAALNRLGKKLTDENIEVIDLSSVNVCKIPRMDEEAENCD